MVPPPNRRKIREKKTSNAINTIFGSVIKILSGNFWNNHRKFISPGGGPYWRGHIREIHDLWSISQRVFDIFREIFFRSKILPISCDKHQKFDYGCSCYPENEAQSVDFGHFYTILGIFRAVCLGTSFKPSTLIFYEKLVQCIYFHMYWEFVFIISSSEPIIDTMQTRFS